MLLLLVISVFIIILFIIIHFSQHFKFSSCNDEILIEKQITFDRNTIINHNELNQHYIFFSRYCSDIQNCTSRLHCCCGIRDNQEFDFFPIAFLFYMIFIFCSCILIALRYICNEEIYWIGYSNNTFIFHNIIHLQYTEITAMSLSLSEMDWFIYICIFISMIWETLFSFYRYYTTMISSKYLYSP
eukprot:543094_1